MKIFRSIPVACLSVLAITMFPLAVDAGTEIRINSANVEFSTETLHIQGLGFPTDGSLEITIGDTFLQSSQLQNCEITPNDISCSLTGTPALAGGTWNVHLSAGNSPNANASIHVYILTGLAACNVGDFVDCYTGDISQVGVGACVSGTRTCLDGGTFSECAGQVTPVSEYPDFCRDGVDNDCDGEVDECRDVLVNNPTIFRQSATFKPPPGVSSINIAAAGGGGGGAGGGSPIRAGQEPIYSGGGGGSGGISILQGYAVTEESKFNVYVGVGGFGGRGEIASRADAEDGRDGRTSSVALDGGGGLLFASGGRGGQRPSLGLGGTGDYSNGNSGGAGALCEMGDPLPGVQGGWAAGGTGGDPAAYEGEPSGFGGHGGDVICERHCEVDIGGVTCTTTANGGDGDPGDRGWVMVWWD